MSIFKIKMYSLLPGSVAAFFTALCCVLILFPMCTHASGAAAEEIVFSKKLYHKHTGSASTSGGCYTVEKEETKTVEKPCKGTMVYIASIDRTSCDTCGASYSGDCSGRECWTTTTETVTERYYALGCEMTESTSLGTLYVSKSTNEWTKSVLLHTYYEVSSKVKVKEKPFIWNGTASKSADFEVTENGTYTVRLNADANTNSANGTVSVLVQNIDVTGPVIASYELEPASEWTKGTVQIRNMQIQDLQPDQSQGCGAHELPFSYDGGVTWTAEGTHSYSENGLHEIQVRDKLENISSHSISISHIDTTPPVVEIEYEKGANQSLVNIAVKARDLQPDGTEGCGLHEEAYSFDGGQNWTAEPSYIVTQNGIVGVAVRDKMENITYMEETVGNIDHYGPQLLYTLTPETWTKQNITVSLAAEDKNADGSAGIGMPAEWYSLDDGSSWQAEQTIIIGENQTLSVLLRDLHNNQSRQEIVIDQIDRQAPIVSLQMRKVEIKGDKKVELLVTARDKQSGLDGKAYSWDGGSVYSDQKSRIISQNGTYQVKVCDKAGNVGSAQIEVDCFAEGGGEEVSPPKPSEEETTEIAEETETEKEERTQEQTEEPESESMEEMESETALVTLEERIDEPESVVKQELKERKGLDLEKLLMTALLTSVCLFLTGILLLLWLRTIAVYVQDCNGKLCYMGRLWIEINEERHEVKVSQRMLEKCMTPYFVFRPTWLFLRSHKEEEMYFYFPGNICIEQTIKAKIEINMC